MITLRRLCVLLVVLCGSALIVGCDDEDLCAPATHATGNTDCFVNSGECFSSEYEMSCVRNATDDGYLCSCFLDGVGAGECENVDACDSDGLFFETSTQSRTERLYSRMETCCGFDLL